MSQIQPFGVSSPVFAQPGATPAPLPLPTDSLPPLDAGLDAFTSANPLLLGLPVEPDHFGRRRGFDGPFRRPRFDDGNGNPAQSRTTVALLEVGPDEPFTEGGKEGHDEAVQQVVQRFTPEAKTVTYSFYPPSDSAEGAKAASKLARATSGDDGSSSMLTVDDINSFIDRSAYSALNQASKRVQEIVRQDPSTGVINMSLGLSKKALSSTLMATAIDSDPATGRALAPQLGVNPNDLNDYYNDPNFSDPAKRGTIQSQAKQNIDNALSTYVNNRFDTPGGDGAQNFQKGIAEWRQVTGQLASQGVVVVVSAGNDRSSESTATQLQNGDELNLLAMSGNVISVGASSSNRPSAKPAEFSSRGGDGFNPTLSADGTNIAVRLDGKRTLVDGTSFSAPTVSAAVARIKETNPNLSFTDIKEILTGTAIDTPASVTEEGAGILNFRGAVNLASRAQASDLIET